VSVILEIVDLNHMCFEVSVDGLRRRYHSKVSRCKVRRLFYLLGQIVSWDCASRVHL